MKSWAMVVGINEYPAEAAQTKLKGAVADACDFAEWALDSSGGNVAPERLYFWTHPWPAEAAGELASYLASDGRPGWWKAFASPQGPTRDRPPSALEIAATMENLGRKEYGRAKEEDDLDTRRVFVFLAGHGIRAKTVADQEETCFVAGDFGVLAGNLASGLLPCDTFRRALLNGRFDEAVVFTDCCRTKVVKTSLVAQSVSDAAGTPLSPWAMGFAANDDKAAYETTSTPVRGAFSSALMQGLRGHRIGEPGELRARHLNEFVQGRISSFTQHEQMPSVLFDPKPDGPVIATGQPTGTEQQSGPKVDVSQLPHGTKLVLHKGDDLPLPGVGPLVVSGPSLQLPPLARGLYLLIVDDGSGRQVQFRYPNLEPIRVE